MTLRQTINFQPNDARAKHMSRWIQDYVAYSSIIIIIAKAISYGSQHALKHELLSKRNFLRSMLIIGCQPLHDRVPLSILSGRLRTSLLQDVAYGIKYFFYLQCSTATRHENSFFSFITTSLFFVESSSFIRRVHQNIKIRSPQQVGSSLFWFGIFLKPPTQSRLKFKAAGWQLVVATMQSWKHDQVHGRTTCVGGQLRC